VVQRGEGLVVGGNVGLQWVVRVGGHRVVGGLEQGIGGKRVEGRGAIFVASGVRCCAEGAGRGRRQLQNGYTFVEGAR